MWNVKRQQKWESGMSVVVVVDALATEDKEDSEQLQDELATR